MLYFSLHRWYQPGTGWYSRPDPLGEIRPEREGLFMANHLYDYAVGNPLFFVDPLGLKVAKRRGLGGRGTGGWRGDPEDRQD